MKNYRIAFVEDFSRGDEEEILEVTALVAVTHTEAYGPVYGGAGRLVPEIVRVNLRARNGRWSRTGTPEPVLKAIFPLHGRVTGHAEIEDAMQEFYPA